MSPAKPPRTGEQEKEAHFDALAAQIRWLEDGTALVRLREPQLSLDRLEVATSALTADKNARPLAVVFDFSEVHRLLGPWTLHFAVMIHLARRLGRPVRVRGLHGQPLDAALLYRNSRQIRDLIEPSIVRRPIAAARRSDNWLLPSGS
ncbi:MAG TPA: hypothetical protein P5304_26135 [Phycisphaerae bacterium]|nr:hypothetical protein [Phycisphaerae bacterium]